MAKSDSITTGVDQLTALIANKNRVSVSEAAKKLHVSKQTVDEWATLLEESGFIKISYTMTSVYLVKREYSPKEQKIQEKKLQLDKYAFDAASDGMVSYLDKFEAQILELRKLIESSKVKKMVPKELQKLRKLEEQRDTIDKGLLETRKDIARKIRNLNQHLQGDSVKFDNTMNNMVNELVGASYVIDLQNREMIEIRKNERFITNRLSKLSKYVDKRAAMLARRKEYKTAQEKQEAAALIRHASDLKKELGRDKRLFVALMKESKKRASAIQRLHNQIIKKIRKQQGRLYGNTPGQIKKFLEQRIHVADMMSAMYHTERVLKEKLIGLIGRRKAITPESTAFEKEMKKISAEFELISNRREGLEKGLKELAAKLK